MWKIAKNTDLLGVLVRISYKPELTICNHRRVGVRSILKIQQERISLFLSSSICQFNDSLERGFAGSITLK